MKRGFTGRRKGRWEVMGGIGSKYIRYAYMPAIVKESVKLGKNELEVEARQSEMKEPAKVPLITKYSDNLMRREEDLIPRPPPLPT